MLHMLNCIHAADLWYGRQIDINMGRCFTVTSVGLTHAHPINPPDKFSGAYGRSDFDRRPITTFSSRSTWLIYTHACTHTDLPLQSLPTNPAKQTHTPFVQVPLTQSGTQSLTVEGEGMGDNGLYDVSVL